MRRVHFFSASKIATFFTGRCTHCIHASADGRRGDNEKLISTMDNTISHQSRQKLLCSNSNAFMGVLQIESAGRGLCCTIRFARGYSIWNISINDDLRIAEYPSIHLPPVTTGS